MENLMFFKKESKIISENTEDEALKKVFNKKFMSLGLGRRVESGMHLSWLKEPIKTIKKGKEIYHVSDASFFANEPGNNQTYETFTRTHAFLIENKGKFTQILFVDQADKFGSKFINDRSKAVIEQTDIPLNPSTDIYDIYNLRFQLKDNKQAKLLIDDFILTGNNKRKHYKLYEIKQRYQQMRTSLQQKKRSNKVRD